MGLVQELGSSSGLTGATPVKLTRFNQCFTRRINSPNGFVNDRRHFYAKYESKLPPQYLIWVSLTQSLTSIYLTFLY